MRLNMPRHCEKLVYFLTKAQLVEETGYENKQTSNLKTTVL